MAAIDPRAIPSQAFGRYNRVIAYNEPGVRGFFARAEGDSSADPTYITIANGVDGPYSVKNKLNILYGNIDWRGTVNEKPRIISWAGPAWRYTNFFVGSFVVIGDTSSRAIYENGRLIATTPFPVIGAALKRIGEDTWIRAMCWQPSTLDWVAVEKIQDAEINNPDNWTEVGRFAFSSIADSESEPTLNAIRIGYQFEAVAFFNRTATKAIGIFLGYKTLSFGKQQHAWLVDFDWPAGSGGPVIFSNTSVGVFEIDTTVSDAGPTNIIYESVRSGKIILARDWDENDQEVQGSITSSGGTDVTITTGATSAQWDVTDNRTETVKLGSFTTKSAVIELVGDKSIETVDVPFVFTANGEATRHFLMVAGFDLRTSFASVYTEQDRSVAFATGLGAQIQQDVTQDFQHKSEFASSLGNITHVDESKPPSVNFVGWPDFLRTYAFPPSAGITTTTRIPRSLLYAPSSFAGGFNTGAFRYQFDGFGNELVFADHPVSIWFLFPQLEDNPAFPPENLLSGGDVQALHNIGFIVEQIGIG